MKKIVSVLLACVILLPALLSCGSGLADETETAAPVSGTAVETAPAKESEPASEEEIPAREIGLTLTERPNYVLNAGATPDEMRATAVKAMLDELSVTWYPVRQAQYKYGSSISGEKTFNLYPTRTYAGVPYSSSYTSLFHFLEYYDMETGRLDVPADELYTTLIGNDCAGSILWAYASCCASFDPPTDGYGRYSSAVVPVGPYRLPDRSEGMNCAEICEMNGRQTMFESYAKLEPADTLFRNGYDTVAGHYVMVIEKPVVVRLADGTIDGANSYVYIQEQRSGQYMNSPDYVLEEDGETRYYSGRRRVKFSFDTVLKNVYLPVTCREFLGESPYVLPSVSLDREVISLDDLGKATLKSAYMICVFRTRLVDEAGNTAYERSNPVAFSAVRSGAAKNYALKSLNIGSVTLSRLAGVKGTFTFELTCVDATGSEFEVASFPVML